MTQAKRIGLFDFDITESNLSYKRDLILFDSICFMTVHRAISILREGVDIFGNPAVVGQRTDIANELEWMYENKILLDATEFHIDSEDLDKDGPLRSYLLDTADVEHDRAINIFEEAHEFSNLMLELATLAKDGVENIDAIRAITPELEKYGASLQENLRRHSAYQLRKAALVINEKTENKAFPILTTTKMHGEQKTETNNLLKLCLPYFPFPDDLTPIQDIIDFREDSEVKLLRLKLERWMSKLAVNEHTDKEIIEEIEYLLETFTRHMSLLTKKYQTGMVETLVVSTSEALEDITKLRFSKLSKKLFSAREYQMELLESELKEPGNEVAYIWKANQHFGTQ